MTDNVTFDVSGARARCRQHRRRILDISQTVSALHIAPAFSCMEIVDTIYYGLMRRDRGPNADDTFIISKGHGSLAQYAVLESLGIVSKAELDLYGKPGGRFATHPDYGLPGIEASTGSLGHGLNLAVGMAAADKVRRADRVVFVVMSDGEFQEGSIWEAMMLAPTLGITRIVGVLDLNDFQSLGQTSKVHPNFYPVLDKVRAFGWETVQVDGHDPAAIHAAIANRSKAKPFMLIARTTKGKGVSFMENVPVWHYRSPTPEEYQAALKELDAQGNLRNWWGASDLEKFKRGTGLVASQFDSYTVLDSVHVNGKLTLGENLADLGGLSVSYAALEKALAAKGKPALIDGFTPEQRFFLAWAQIWRQNINPEAQRVRINTDPHSPGQWRTNGPLSNLPQFAAAFGCKPGDAMVRPDSVRPVIW